MDDEIQNTGFAFIFVIDFGKRSSIDSLKKEKRSISQIHHTHRTTIPYRFCYLSKKNKHIETAITKTKT